LKRFTKVELNPKESTMVKFSLSVQDMTFIGINNLPVLEAGDFVVEIGRNQAQFTLQLQDSPTMPSDNSLGKNATML
jgi:beta-glucosidase